MKLDLRGRPIHSRNLDVEVLLDSGGRWQVRGELVDVRKSGFVPIAGDLQLAGLLHHMLIHARVDPETRRIEAIAASQPRVAFEPSTLSRGECCRDPVRRIEVLAGTPLDTGFARRLGEAIGGARGCSHVLALARLLGSTLIRALARERGAEPFLGERGPGPRAWRAGERVLRRTLSIDASEPEASSLELALQLTEVSFVPTAEAPRPIERLGRMVEVRSLARLELGASGLRAVGAELRSLLIGERDRGPDQLDDASWRDIPGAQALVGGPLVTSRVLALFPMRPAGDPAVDLLLQLAPGALQAASSSLGESWPALAARSASRIVCAGPPDSCYMWRRGGALDAARLVEESTRGSDSPGRE